MQFYILQVKTEIALQIESNITSMWRQARKSVRPRGGALATSMRPRRKARRNKWSPSASATLACSRHIFFVSHTHASHIIYPPHCYVTAVSRRSKKQNVVAYYFHIHRQRVIECFSSLLISRRALSEKCCARLTRNVFCRERPRWHPKQKLFNVPSTERGFVLHYCEWQNFGFCFEPQGNKIATLVAFTSQPRIFAYSDIFVFNI